MCGTCSSSAIVGSTVVFSADFACVVCTIDRGGGRNLGLSSTMTMCAA